ncbi:MAG: hypothetical protein BWK80_42725, partial [Desulfobacteraceae bacterium IS3]
PFGRIIWKKYWKIKNLRNLMFLLNEMRRAELSDLTPTSPPCPLSEGEGVCSPLPFGDGPGVGFSFGEGQGVGSLRQRKNSTS